jgi:hypothetical protein
VTDVVTAGTRHACLYGHGPPVKYRQAKESQQLSIQVDSLLAGALPWAGAYAAHLLSHEIVPSWPSLLAALPAWIGYRLNRRKNPLAWLFMFAGNSLLVVAAVVAHQWGLLIAAPLAREALLNWLAWRREERAAKATPRVLAA